MQLPFNKSLINKNRFHGLIQGQFTEHDGKILLATEFGSIKLYPRNNEPIHYGGRWPSLHALFRARRQFKEDPAVVVNVYGYPRTDAAGIIYGIVMTNWFVDGKNISQNSTSLCKKFNPGQMFLCGRVKRIESNNVIRVRVKSQIPGVGLRWWDVHGTSLETVVQHSKILFMGWCEESGKLILQPIQTITPPGQKTCYKDVAAEQVEHSV
jgi:hypothetical protein